MSTNMHAHFPHEQQNGVGLSESIYRVQSLHKFTGRELQSVSFIHFCLICTRSTKCGAWQLWRCNSKDRWTAQNRRNHESSEFRVVGNLARRHRHLSNAWRFALISITITSTRFIRASLQATTQRWSKICWRALRCILEWIIWNIKPSWTSLPRSLHRSYRRLFLL